MCGSTNMKCLEQSKLQRQKVEWLLPGSEERDNDSYCLMDIEFQFGKMKRMDWSKEENLRR